MKKRLFLLFFAFLLTLTAATADGVGKVSMVDEISRDLDSYVRCDVKLDGKSLDSDVPAILYVINSETRTLVPIRVITEKLGVDVRWNGKTKEVSLQKDDKEIVLTIDSPEVVVDGKVESLPSSVPAKLMSYNGKARTLVPLRFVTEAYGLLVKWDGKTKTVLLERSDEEDKASSDASKNNSDEDFDEDKDRLHKVSSVVFDDLDEPKEIKITFEENRVPKLREFYLKSDDKMPERLVVDFSNTDISAFHDFSKVKGMFEKKVNSTVISKVRLAQFSINPKKIVRMVIDFKKLKMHSLIKSKNSITIKIGDGDKVITNENNKYIPKSSPKTSEKCFKYERVKSGEYAVLKFSEGVYTRLKKAKDTADEVIFEAGKDDVELLGLTKKINDEFLYSYQFDTSDKEVNRVILRPKSGVEIYENPLTKNKHIHEIVMKISSDKTNFPNDKVTIVLDPGHGGSDPGALRRDRGIKEVHIIDKAVPYLKQYLEDMGYRVLLTRDSDVYVTLYGRVKYAELQHADLLVSIHANTIARKDVSGVEIFANKRRADKIETVKLAKSILASMLKYAKCPKRGVRDYNLYITREASMTSTLVELGFISNDAELAKLLNNDYSKGLSKSIAVGIDNYVKATPVLHKKQGGGTGAPVESEPVDKTVAKEVQVDKNNNLLYPDMLATLVNRTHKLPSYYEPSDLIYPDVHTTMSNPKHSRLRRVAAKALKDLFTAAMEEDDVAFSLISAYRAYSEQKAIYDYSVEIRGEEETRKIIAYPGTSEHQTGLTASLIEKDNHHNYDRSFGSTKAGKWLKNNAHKYGFVIRYPENKTEITGYNYSPWQLRYVGKNLAEKLYYKGLCLEEYYKK